jgi:hypothetical protein
MDMLWGVMTTISLSHDKNCGADAEQSEKRTDAAGTETSCK